MENNGEERTIGCEMRKEIADESEIHTHYKLTLEDAHYRFEQWREEKINAYDKVLSGVSLRDRQLS
jgi:cyclopropane fatty-acyl-phospholipid synthase-like methyltransferase